MSEKDLSTVEKITTPSTAPHLIDTKQGMWSRGSGDTSGFDRIVRRVEMPGQTTRPFGGWFDAVVDRVLELAPEMANNLIYVDRGELTLYVDRDQVLKVFKCIRDDAHLRFEVCESVSGINYPEDKAAELHVSYDLLSYTHNRRIRLEVTCADEDPHIPSIVGIYPMADWHEREVWDMFGVIFDGHPALTRILMPDDWVGHPQRKDYPLGGIPIDYKGAKVPPPDERRDYS